MDGQSSRGVVASGNFKTRRVELPCLLKREVLKSMGIAQLRTIGRSNRRARPQEKEPGPAVSSTVPSTSQTTTDQTPSSQAATNQPPSSPPAQKSAVLDEDCVISHIQPPAPRKRALTDGSGRLLPGAKPVPPLKIKRVRGNDGSVSYRVKDYEGVVNSYGGVNARDLNMRVWPRKCWSGRGSPYLPTNSRAVSTTTTMTTTSTTAATPAGGGRSGNVVDLTGNSEDEEDRGTSDLHSCSRTMEFRKAIMRSCVSGSAAQINGMAIDSLSHKLLMRTSLPGSSYRYIRPTSHQSLPSSVPDTFRNSFTPSMMLPPSYLTASPTTTTASFNAMPFATQSGPGNRAAFSAPSPAASWRAPVQFTVPPSELPMYPNRDNPILRSLLSGSGGGTVPPRTPRMTPPKSTLSRATRFVNSTHRTELGHPAQQQAATTGAVVSSTKGVTRFRHPRDDKEREVVQHDPPWNCATAGSAARRKLAGEPGGSFRGNRELEAMLEREEVLDMKTVNRSVYLLVKKHPDRAPEWITVSQCRTYLCWKRQWNLQTSPCNGEMPGVARNNSAVLPLPSAVPGKPPIPNCVKGTSNNNNMAKLSPSSLLLSSDAKKKPKEKFVAQVSASSRQGNRHGSSGTANRISSASGGGSSVSNHAPPSHPSPGLPRSSAATTIAVTKNALNDYQLQLRLWQEQLNRQCSGREVVIFVENVVDQAPVPLDFTYITESVRTEGIPSSEVLLGCKCQKCDASCKQCCSGLAGCPFPYTKAGRLRVAPGTPIYECNDACRCGAGCYNRVVQKGRVIPLTIFRTRDGRGWGVHTRQPIKKNTFVTEYVGEIITNREAERRGAIYDEEGSTYLFDLDFHEEDVDDGEDSLFTIDARKFGNISHFINHSCDPNLQVYSVWIETLDHRLPHLAFFALKDIQQNEELTFDYNMGRNMANITSKPKIKCLCGVSNCAGFLY